MAANTASNLNAHYANLATSTQRLSTGLRVNSAKDDAAGLAIRELQRAEISALQQGVRNANDAISLLQVADGALAIIDEKLIRMKELAEQASTGTYDSTQRLMIDSEFQAMAAEIDRIANATDFNGIKLLDGSKQGEHNGSGLNSTGALKIHFGTGNDSAEDYYYININDASTRGLGLSKKINRTLEERVDVSKLPNWWKDATIDYDNQTIYFNYFYNDGVSFPSKYKVLASGRNNMYPLCLSKFELPKGLYNVDIKSETNGGPYGSQVKPHITIFSPDGEQYTGIECTDRIYDMGWSAGGASSRPGTRWWTVNNDGELIEKFKESGLVNDYAIYKNCVIDNANDEVITKNNTKITLYDDMTEDLRDDENIHIDKLNEDLFILEGPYINPSSWDGDFEITITAKFNLKDEEYEMIHIDTQDNAQKALVQVDNAIVSKDKIRAQLGNMQSRLENTATNLTTQSENLQASESRISDADIATEMTNFVRNQILTQSAVAMLSQANSLPQMVMQLIQ